ncbi:MAG: hypothetical protein IJC81_00050 [Clostridia bacterium]|nr:hypothetical protein [Clostridia bacterium]
MYENDFCEYVVEKKKEGGYLGKIIAVTVLLLALIIISITVLVPKFGIVGMLAFIAAAVLAWYLYRYLNIECEYSQSGAFIDFAYVYSKQYRKDKLSLDIKKSVCKVAPFEEGFASFNVASVLDMRSSSKSASAYMIIYEIDDKKHAVLFDATKRLVDNLFHQIPSLVVRTDNLPE